MHTQNKKRTAASETRFFNISTVELKNAWTDFVLSRVAMQCTHATLKNYQKILGKFINWLEAQGVTAPHELNARLVREYLALYASKSDWYLNGIARSIRTLVRFWHSEGYLPSPVIFAMPKVREKRLPFLNGEQVKKLLSVCSLREKAIILLFIDSGLRRQEFVNLNREDIDMQTGFIRVRQGKGRKDRTTAIGATTRRVLLKYWQTCSNQSPNAPAIQTNQGERFSADGLSSLLSRLSKKAGVPFSPHALRRSFATLALKSGMDIVSLQALLGHSNIDTTRKYVQWLDADLLEAHRKASPIDNLK
ncbi:MAG: tyrosine-type recombinase/integrase [Anaerolineae bacterium]|nr:tyrosine-type recombinase/integrase [Anaerolineae bacterium]